MFAWYGKILGKISTKARLAIGMAGIVVSIVLVSGMLGLIPNERSLVLEGRAGVAEAIAVNSSVFITQSDLWRMENNLRVQVERQDQLLSAGIRREDGRLMVDVGNEHANHWAQAATESNQDSQLYVPIWQGDKRWGQVELRFTPYLPSGIMGYLLDPFLQLLMIVMWGSFIFFYFYLGKMLKQLDPSQAIPDRVKSAFDTMAEGLLVLDAKQNIVLANDAFATLMGVDAEKVIGSKVNRFEWDFVDSQDAESYPWETALKYSEATINRMVKLTLPSGAIRTFMTNCSPVLAGGGKAAGVLVSLDDVTLLEEKEVELRKSKDEAEAANRAKSDFLANMSHEIRTPMNAILGFTEVLKRGYGKNPKESGKYLNTIASSGEHLLGLINDILDLSKVEAGQVEVERIHCPLHHIVHEVIQIMRVKADEKGLYLRYEPKGDLPEHITSDPARVRQILTNLIGNAIKFTESGGVLVETQMSDTNKVLLTVVDTGIGMTAPQADAVFQPFVQADSSITRRFGGTGLGLTISKQFAEALGGGIRVTSKEGQGSRFIASLNPGDVSQVNWLTPAQLLEEQQHLEIAENQQWQFDGQPVLVVDDGDENRNLLEVVLGDAGLTIDTAENGQEACDRVAENSYQMILMDVQMPVMDGYTAVKLMRDRGVELPIVALTAHAMKGAEEKCLEAGYSGYMTKPIKIDRLFKLVADTVGGRLVEKADETVPEPESSIDSPNVQQMAEPQIHTTLPLTNPKFQQIVSDFIAKLAQQVDAMDEALALSEAKQLADLAHWLKGSAGSVGFQALTEVAKPLELSAKEANMTACADHLIEIKRLQSRLVDPLESISAVDSPARESSLNVAAVESRGEATDFSEEYDVPDVIESRLADYGEKFVGIILKFHARLLEQMPEAEEMLNLRDGAKLKGFAHWLKGSAGSVGFDVFTQPAADLEQAVLDEDFERADYIFGVLSRMVNRILIPALRNDDEPIKNEL
ncbi:MAG: response regulator [Cellvibrionaceae bacterium]